jgi:translation initiation factor IF-3
MIEKNLVVTRSNVYQIGKEDVRISPSTEYANSEITKGYKALEIAENNGLDLVIINPNIKPMIVKIMDYKKFVYNQKKQEKEQAKKNRANAVKVKEVKFHLNIGENDFNYKINHIKEFIEDGYKVKCQIFLRGREREFKDIADEMTKQIIDSCLEFSQIIEKPSSQGNTINFAFIKGKD